MGRVVTFGELPGEAIADGVSRAAITKSETVKMAADFIRVAPGKRWTSSVPRGSDCYLFMLNGSGTISAGADRHPFPAQAFATIQEGVEFSVANDGASPADVVRVLAPPQPTGRALAGFRDTLSVAQRAKMPIVDIAAEKKKRIYFGHHAAKSERGHAMIVVYEESTVTDLHHHPNAESMFVVIDGALQFTVNGAQAIVRPGQAAYFGINDRHGLHTAPDNTGASFLEFHIPAAFTTVKSPALGG